jgi:hypothetical protein
LIYIPFHALLALLDPLYRVNSIKSLMVKSVHELPVHILLHIFNVEFVLCIVVVLTTSDPICLGTKCYLMCFMYFVEALDALLIHEEGADTVENY